MDILKGVLYRVFKFKWGLLMGILYGDLNGDLKWGV